MSIIKRLQFRSRWWWSLIFILSPLAYAAGIWLQLDFDPNVKLPLQVDRKSSIAAAREFAAQHGIEARDWTSGVRAQTDNNRYFYYRSQPRESLKALAQDVAPEVFVRVRLVAPNNDEFFDTTIAPDAHPLGYSYTPPEKFSVGDVEESVSRRAADEAVKRFAAVLGDDVNIDAPNPDTKRTFAATTRLYAYRLHLPSHPEVALTRTIGSIGNQIISEETTFEVDKPYAASFINHSTFDDIGNFLFIGSWTFLFIYSLFRYAQITRQKEVPHRRVFVLFAVMALVLIYVSSLTDYTVFDMPRNRGYLFWLFVIFSALGQIALSLGVSLAYGSGEGDVREAYPLSLTSIDAFLTGRIFSRNIARSVLVGVGLGGWMVLLNQIGLLAFVGRADGGIGLGNKSWQILFGQYVTLMPIVQPLAHGLTSVVFSLLLPLSLLRHRLRGDNRRRWWIVFGLICVATNFNLGNDAPMIFPALVWHAVMTSLLLCVAFFKFDLLAAAMTAGMFALTNFAVLMIGQSPTALKQSGYIAVGLALLFIAFECLAFRRGRTVGEAEVRPVYARHLAERVQLQAEVNAAREAQIRLLPDKLPTFENLQIAAACHPAHTVGGDFFDLIALDEHRLGIFVAEGGERGLEAALTIAYAKGFLMPMLRSHLAPAEIMCHLQTQLQTLLVQNVQLGVAYAVIDSHARTLSYARTGSSPRFFIERNTYETNEKHRAAHDTAMFENALRTLTPQNELAPEGESGFECVIREAEIQLEHGDALLISTDGIPKLSGLDDANDTPRKLLLTLAAQVRQQPKTGAANDLLQIKLNAAMQKHSRKARRINLEDDLTAVVVYVDGDSNSDRSSSSSSNNGDSTNRAALPI